MNMKDALAAVAAGETVTAPPPVGDKAAPETTARALHSDADPGMRRQPSLG